jgi:hypothetical protein
VKLVSLNVGSCVAISDEGLKQVSSCLQLQDLNLWRLEVTPFALCSKTQLFLLKFVTDRGLSVVATKCVSLSSLVVTDCKNVTSLSLSKFNAACRIYC